MTKRQQGSPPHNVVGATTVEPTPTAFAARHRRFLRGSTLALWSINGAALAVGAAMTSLFLFMPVSLEVDEAITAGLTPWFDAGRAAALFATEIATVAISLVLYHRTRFAAVAWVLTGLTVVTLGATTWVVERDWF